MVFLKILQSRFLFTVNFLGIFLLLLLLCVCSSLALWFYVSLCVCVGFTVFNAANEFEQSGKSALKLMHNPATKCLQHEILKNFDGFFRHLNNAFFSFFLISLAKNYSGNRNQNDERILWKEKRKRRKDDEHESKKKKSHTYYRKIKCNASLSKWNVI